jgi:TRAP transporter 4TM/12TM fusion protein
LPHFVDIMAFTTDGLFGVPLRVAATYAFLFVMFGTALAKTGGADFFFDLAASISGRATGGPAKIAVISSALYGTISGSPTSDVVTTGAVTIPMMKKMGYKSSFAGAVEVAASTGGSLLPPVMGAAAFIMSEYTGIPYIDIAFAAIIPALLYYLPIYLQVHLRAQKDGLRGMEAADIRPVGITLRNGGLFLVPLVVITWVLVEGYTPTYAAVYGTAAVAVVSMLKSSTRLTPSAVFDILAETSLRMVAVTGACAAAGLVIGGITMTGLASKFSHLVFLLSGANIFLSLVLAAGLTILLGLGMPTPSAYILAAVLVAPVMASLGIDPMAGHMFLLYFAVMSALTPPVAVAAYAASAISGDNPLAIAAMAVRMALAAFLIPKVICAAPSPPYRGSVWRPPAFCCSLPPHCWRESPWSLSPPPCSFSAQGSRPPDHPSVGNAPIDPVQTSLAGGIQGCLVFRRLDNAVEFRIFPGTVGRAVLVHDVDKGVGRDFPG